MFKKPPSLKPSTPLRSSSRRAFLAHLQALYPALTSVSAETLKQLVPSILKQCSATTSGNQKAVIYTDEDGRPLWFELGSNAGAALQQAQKKSEKGGPSTQSRLAEIVDPTLLAGSALMIPGLVPPPNTFPDAQLRGIAYPPSSSLIAITAYPSSVPMVVARSELDMESMCKKRAGGEKGKAATTIHAKGDFLWEMGGKGNAPSDEEILRKRHSDQLNRDGETGGVVGGMEGLTLAGESNGNSAVEDSDVAADPASGEVNGVGGPSTDSSFTTAEVDAIMHVALLHSVAKLAKTPTQLPIPLSLLHSSLVLPDRPAHWPPRDAKGRSKSRLADRLLVVESSGREERAVHPDSVDIKRTSAKKLSKWIKSAEKSELLKCKEVKGKDTVVVSINGSHAELSSLAPYYTLAQAQQDSSGSSTGVGDSLSTADGSVKTAVVIEKFWRAAASSVKLFQEMGASTSEPLSQPVIRAHLQEYIASQNLVDGRNQARIRLEDPALVHALYPKMALSDIPVSLTRQEMLERLLATSCVEYHRTSRLSPAHASRVERENAKGKPTKGDGGEATATESEAQYVGPMTKGAAKAVTVEIKTRQGRKVVSLITGLEVYGLDPHSLAHELMKSGASASATALPSSTANHPKHEVFVQGDQRKVIYDFVESHGLDRRFVHIVDSTKK